MAGAVVVGQAAARAGACEECTGICSERREHVNGRGSSCRFLRTKITDLYFQRTKKPPAGGRIRALAAAGREQSKPHMWADKMLLTTPHGLQQGHWCPLEHRCHLLQERESRETWALGSDRRKNGANSTVTNPNSQRQRQQQCSSLTHPGFVLDLQMGAEREPALD